MSGNSIISASNIASVAAILFSRNLFVEFGNQLRTRAGKQRSMWRHPPRFQTRVAPRRIEMIFALLDGPVRYLEIGLSRGKTFEAVSAIVRHAVDPVPRVSLRNMPAGTRVFVETSDEFFARSLESSGYDVVYVDGLHTWKQTYRDILNSFAHSPRAIVLVDDVVPSDEISAMPEQEQSLRLRRSHGDNRNEWCGDVFKVVQVVSSRHPEIEMLTLVSPGYPQTMMWLKDSSQGLSVRVETDARDVELAEFGTVFADGIPSYFNPMTETDGFAVLKSVVEKRRRPRA